MVASNTFEDAAEMRQIEAGMRAVFFSLTGLSPQGKADAIKQILAAVKPLIATQEREAIKRVIDGGSFLHDRAPTRLWANDLLLAIDRDAAKRAAA